MILVASIVLGLLLLVSTSSVLLALGVGGWVVHAGVIVAVQVSLRRPFHEAGTTMLVVAYAADLLSSGPPGAHAFVLALVFFTTFGIARRVGGRFLLAVSLMAFGASLILDLSEGLLLSLFYPEISGLRMFLRWGLWSALATAVVAVPYAMLLGVVERMWLSRSGRTVAVD